MNGKQIEELIIQMEHHLECWKQFNYYLNLARSKQFEMEDETQFLEIKSVLVQELELILATVNAGGAPDREEIHSLIGSAASIRYMSEMTEGALRGLETQWHKIYIGYQSLLGKMKVARRSETSKSILSGLFTRKAA